MTWEYLNVLLPKVEESHQSVFYLLDRRVLEVLNAYGAQGWECYGIDRGVALFKKEKV